MQDTVFHKIVRGELPAFVIYEDNEFMAFLDRFPANYGRSIVTPKTHATSKFSQVDPELMAKLIKVGQKVAQLLEEKLNDVERCQVVIEGLEMDYLHLKLFPTFKSDHVANAVTRGHEELDMDIPELEELHLQITS